ncbi:MAG: putative capsid protein [Circoviridae sp.]|nr:MAG: putative capsid protein [Circoviridae sp.]
MPRRFSGPLLPGKRSVRSYESKRARGKRLAAMKIQRGYRRRRSNYKPTSSFARQMTKWNSQNAEKKLIPYKNYTNGVGPDFLIEIPGEALPNAGLTNDNTSCLVIQTGDELTDANQDLNSDTGMPTCTAIGGYNFVPYTSTTPMGATGQYVKITSSMINFNINMDPLINSGDADAVAAAMMPHQFRIIQVKARRTNSVASGIGQTEEQEPELRSNLFINEAGSERGLKDDMAAQDPFTWFINQQKWLLLKDERFTLSNYAQFFTSNTSGSQVRAPISGVSKFPSQKFKKYYFPCPKGKTKLSDLNDGSRAAAPTDFNYVTHTVILCKNMGGSGQHNSLHWNLQVNGTTAFMDI